MEILSNPIDFLKGVGPSRANLLKKELNIFTYKDLLYYFPFRYIDKSKIYNHDGEVVGELLSGNYLTLEKFYFHSIIKINAISNTKKNA